MDRSGEGRRRRFWEQNEGVNNGTHTDVGMHQWVHSAPWEKRKKQLLHKHFFLEAAICFSAVCSAWRCFLSDRICPVSLSSIHFHFSPWHGWEAEESGLQWGKQRGRALNIMCALFLHATKKCTSLG